MTQTNSTDIGAIRSLSRRDVLRTTGALGVAGLGLRYGSGRASAASPWTIAVLPDTQKYTMSSSRIAYAEDQVDWIRANRRGENIVFVSHVGDLVEDGDDTNQWRRIDDVMDKLDGAVPYATAVGNHDYETTNSRSSGTANYSRYFGRRRFGSKSWFLGSSPNDRAHYQRFSAGGYDFMHMDLEWGVPGSVSDSDSVMGWAHDVLSRNRNTPTIITTHSYLWDRRGREGHAGQRKGANSGRDIYKKLVRKHPQVFMVLCGHFHYTDGEHQQVSKNDDGSNVYEILSDYQDYDNGGDGWMRLVEFVPGGGRGSNDRVTVRTYSPSRRQFKSGSGSRARFDFDFDERFGGSDAEAPSETSGDEESLPQGALSFQQGEGGYSGTRDTYLWEAEPDGDYGQSRTLVVDRSDPRGSGKESQALLRFGDVVGSGADQIPEGATVTAAVLQLETLDPGSGASLHRMRIDWDDSATWSSFDGGVQTDGTHAASRADAKTGSTSNGTTTIDVTESVRAWVGGDSNYGWVFVPSGRNGWDFSAAEGTEPPKLVVEYRD